MNEYSKLKENVRALAGRGGVAITQGIVEQVDGDVCRVRIGNIVIPGVRLRASETDDAGKMLIVPKVGTAVTVGSLSGDLTDLVVLRVDHVERVTINGGKLGGLINIDALTEKINELVRAFNSHTHTVTVAHPGGTFTTMRPADEAKAFKKTDYEDDKIRH